MERITKAISVATLCCSLAPCISSAQESETFTLPELRIEASELQPFNPGRGTLENPADVPLTLSLVSPYDMATLKDTLRYTPGLSTQTGNGVFDFFTLRGFDSLTAVNVAIDGVVEPETTFYHMHDIEQVQIAKGPLSTYFGRDSLAGNVNLIRKRPEDEAFTVLGIEGGSFGTLGTDIDANLKSGTRVNAFYEQGDGFRDDMDHEAYALSIAQTLSKSDRLKATLFADYAFNDYTPDAGIPTLGPMLAPGVDLETSFQADDDFSEQEIFRLALDVETELSDRWLLQNKTYFTDFSWESSGVIFGSFAKFGAGLEQIPSSLARIKPELDDSQQIIGNHLALRGDFDRHALLVGGEIRQFTDEFTLPLNPTTDIDIYTREESQGVIPPIPAQAGDATLLEYSLYAIDEVKLHDRLSVLGGLRGHLFDFEDDTQDTDREDEKLAGSLGVLFKVNEEVGTYVNVGNAFASPSTQTQGPRGEPEESNSVEAGVRFKNPDQSVSANLAAFWIERENIAIPTSTGASAANGSQEAQGIEVDVRSKITDAVQVILAYTWLDSELSEFTEFDARGLADHSGNTSAFAPENTVALRGQYYIGKGFALNTGIVWQDSQYISPDNGFEIDAQTYTEAGISFGIDRWLASVSVRNLLDEELYGRGSGSTSVRPEDGVGVFGRLETRF